MNIDLSPDEVHLVREALESAEYWEHRDQLRVDSGYIIDPEEGPNGEWHYEGEPLDEEALEAWESVQELRKLDARFAMIHVRR